MEWHGKGLDQGSLEHGKEICSSFKSNEVIKIKSNRKSRNKSEKFSKKESSEIQGVTSQVVHNRGHGFSKRFNPAGVYQLPITRLRTYAKLSQSGLLKTLIEELF